MKKNRESFLTDIVQDAYALRAMGPSPSGLRSWIWLFASTDAYWILFLQRIRTLCRRNHIPFAGRLCRIIQLVLYGIEISPTARLGHGVFFLHSVGVVIGGDA